MLVRVSVSRHWRSQGVQVQISDEERSAAQQGKSWLRLCSKMNMMWVDAIAKFHFQGHFEAVSYTHLTLPTIYSV